MAKAILSGKRYDTDTATFIAEESGGQPGDWRYWETALYRTPRGAWFTVGSGGPLSSYGAREGQTRRGRTNVFAALDETAALQLLEAWGQTDAIEAYLGSAVKDA